MTVEPCLMCVGALLWARVDHIYYGCEDPKNAGLRSVLSLIDNGRFEHKFKIIQGGILAEICSDLIRDFFHKIRLTDLNVPSSG